MVEWLTAEKGVSLSRSCRVVGLSRSQHYYLPRGGGDDSEVEAAIREAAVHGEGFWKIYARLRASGHPWNHKKVYRVYKGMDMPLRQRKRQRVPARERVPLSTPESPGETWSMDFVSDRLASGGAFRVLTVLDDCTREAVAVEVGLSMPSQLVTRLLEDAFLRSGKPQRIRTDNGPEFTSGAFEEWCRRMRIEHILTQPGCPTQNSYIERFNGSFRRAVLNRYEFHSMEEAERIAAGWVRDYNESRPHDALGGETPAQRRKRLMGR